MEHCHLSLPNEEVVSGLRKLGDSVPPLGAGIGISPVPGIDNEFTANVPLEYCGMSRLGSLPSQ